MWRALLLVVLLSGCRDDAGPASGDLPPVGAALVAATRGACESSGGRWGQGGTGGRLVCYRDMADAGRSCRAAGDCGGVCLARSQTCAPVAPLFGCNDVLDRTGRPSEVCLD